MSEKKSSSPFEKLVPLLVIISIGLAFGVGVLWQKVSNIESGTSTGTVTNTNPQQPAIEQPSADGKLSEAQVAKIVPVTKDDHIKGSLDAEVFLIEYSDLECPFCAKFHPTAHQILDEYDGKVAWIYRHFPLDQLHSKARPAAEASECIADLGGNDAFWTFIDEVFSDPQTNLSNLSGVAQGIGVDMDDFNECADGGDFADAVQAQNDGGLAIGITGTPGNVIINKNGDAWLLPGAFPFDQVKAVVDQALEAG